MVLVEDFLNHGARGGETGCADIGRGHRQRRVEQDHETRLGSHDGLLGGSDTRSRERDDDERRSECQNDRPQPPSRQQLSPHPLGDEPVRQLPPLALATPQEHRHRDQENEGPQNPGLAEGHAGKRIHTVSPPAIESARKRMPASSGRPYSS